MSDICFDESLRGEVCMRERGHAGAHVANLGNLAVAWGIDTLSASSETEN